MRLIRNLVLVALLSAGLVVTVGTGPALACSCAMAETAEHVAGADVVVSGTLVDIDDPPPRLFSGSSGPVTYTVDVDAVYRGEAHDELAFTSNADGASCGLEGLEADHRYAFFLYRADDGLSANLCGGTSDATAELLAQIEAVTGPGHPPTAGPGPGVASDPEPGWVLPGWVLGGGVLGLVGLVGSLWARLLRPVA